MQGPYAGEDMRIITSYRNNNFVLSKRILENQRV